MTDQRKPIHSDVPMTAELVRGDESVEVAWYENGVELRLGAVLPDGGGLQITVPFRLTGQSVMDVVQQAKAPDRIGKAVVDARRRAEAEQGNDHVG